MKTYDVTANVRGVTAPTGTPYLSINFTIEATSLISARSMVVKMFEDSHLLWGTLHLEWTR